MVSIKAIASDLKTPEKYRIKVNFYFFRSKIILLNDTQSINKIII